MQLNGSRRVKVFSDKILIFISVKKIGPFNPVRYCNCPLLVNPSMISLGQEFRSLRAKAGVSYLKKMYLSVQFSFKSRETASLLSNENQLLCACFALKLGVISSTIQIFQNGYSRYKICSRRILKTHSRLKCLDILAIYCR